MRAAIALVWLLLLPAPAAALTPRDPAFPQQWGMDNTGQSVAGRAGTPDADVDAPEAWNVTTGSDDVVVAVVDSGIAADQPDLAERIWHNPGEAAPHLRANGIDDDGNGHVDDWQGWDVVGRSVVDPGDSDNDPRDISGHGTHVAGILGATGDNGIGVTGMSWRGRIMNVRIRGERSNERPQDLAQGFRYAARNGARIVNASLAETERLQAVEDVMRTHPQTLFIVAAGNRAVDLDRPGEHSYPCEYDAPNLLCVAATHRDDRLASFSSWGSHVHLAAPGSVTLSSHPAYEQVATESFESDPFGAGRWTRGGAGNRWTTTTDRRAAGTRSVTSGAPRAGADTWIQSAALDLSGRMGCEVRPVAWLDAGEGSGLYIQARGDTAFLPASTAPAQDSSHPTGDTVAFYGTSLDGERKVVNISDLDGDASVFLRFGVLSGAGAQAWLDDVDVRCLGGSYSADGRAELAFMQGTSMATPHVAGIAALIAARYPQRSAAEIKADLLRAVDPLPWLAGKVTTGGRVNAYKAVARTSIGVRSRALHVEAVAGTRSRLRLARVVDPDGVARYRVSDPWTPYGEGPMAGSRLVPGDGACVEEGDAGACLARGVQAVSLDAGDLDDAVDAADGVAEAVDCGTGDDTARVDQLDTVSGCERTTVEPVAPVDTSGDVDVAGPRLRVLRPRLRDGRFRVRVRATDEDASGVVRFKRRGRTLAKARFEVAAGRTVRVTAAPRRRDVRGLRRLRRPKVRAVVVARDVVGNATTVRRAFRVKAP